jgi:hypothetical protein
MAVAERSKAAGLKQLQTPACDRHQGARQRYAQSAKGRDDSTTRRLGYYPKSDFVHVSDACDIGKGSIVDGPFNLGVWPTHTRTELQKYPILESSFRWRHE